MKTLLSIIYLLTLWTFSYCQEIKTTSSNLIDPALNEIQNIFMDRQAAALLTQAKQVFSQYLPNWPEPKARRSALMLLDGVLHDVYAPMRLPVQNFFKTRMKMAIDEIEQTKVTYGAYIWKMYNHGFVVRTKSVTIGFDLIRAKSVLVEGFSISDDDMERLIKQCDVLFISHDHGDHREEWVTKAFLDQGKPVTGSPTVLNRTPVYEDMTHLKREPHTIQTLVLKDGKRKLQVVIYPGHQGFDCLNNVPLIITPEGLSFSHMGDQCNDDDFVWIDEVARHHEVDVLLPNCWTADIARAAKGFNPKLIVTGHENEMGHTIDHREPYWLTYQRREDIVGSGYDYPLILMTWGESYHYKRENF
jgi:L-ascorbate metabolism protein UlaG (beta-lactamase superfamily)